MSAGGPPRVVIADDEEEIRDLLTEYLEAHGSETVDLPRLLESIETAFAMAALGV